MMKRFSATLVMVIIMALPRLVLSEVPVATTLSATGVTGSQAVLTGMAHAGNLETTVMFEYGTTTSYGSTSAISQGSINGDITTLVTSVISGLARSTSYHYRVVASNGEGTSYGDDQQFTTTACDLLADGSFEATTQATGTPYNPNWEASSTNFDSPLYYIDTCIPDVDCGTALPLTGNWFAWFGGIVDHEVGTLTQSVLIPSGSLARLNLYLYNPDSSGNGQDHVRVLVDNTEIFKAITGDTVYANGYAKVDVDLAAFADGGCHSVSIQSTTDGNIVNDELVYSNFYVDDVAIPACGATVALDNQPVATIQTAINGAAGGSIVTATAHSFAENVHVTSSGDVAVRGGFNCDLQTSSSRSTTLEGDMFVEGSSVVLESFLVKGKMVVSQGSLRVKGVTIM